MDSAIRLRISYKGVNLDLFASLLPNIIDKKFVITFRLIAHLRTNPCGHPKRPVFELVIQTLKSALDRLDRRSRPILHSDQGWQYKMLPYRKMISKYGLTQSMSRKGNCFDNAAIESFFGTLKAEFFRLTEFDSIEQLDAGVHDYIRYYNHERIKLKLNGLSPVDSRSQFATQSASL